MKYDYIYDKNTAADKEEYTTKYYETVAILLKEENLMLNVNSNGQVALCDAQEKVLQTKNAKSEKYPDRHFSAVLLNVSDNKVDVKMLMQDVVDHYPHCDGEYDRYSTIVKDEVVLSFELE